MDKDRIAGAAKTFLSALRAAVGKVTGDPKFAATGRAERKIGKVNSGFGGFYDTILDIRNTK